MERMLLRYFVNDEWAARGLQPLNSIFEQVSRPVGWRNSFFEQLDTPEEKGALSAILERMVGDGLLVSKASDDGHEIFYGASDKALKMERYDEIYPPTNAIVNESGEPLMKENGQLIVTEEPAEVENISVDSATWTGLTKVIIDARNANVVSKMMDQAIASLASSGATNFQIMQATAYLKAAKDLVDAPEPPSEEIWRFISRAADLVSLLGVFYSIFVRAVK